MVRIRRTQSEIEDANIPIWDVVRVYLRVPERCGLPDCAAEFGRQNNVCEETFCRWNKDPG